MTYDPINEENKQQWVDWLNSVKNSLEGKPENKTENSVFETPDGDVATGKDVVGNLLALLTNEQITIN